MSHLFPIRRIVSSTFFLLVIASGIQAHNLGLRLVPVLSGSMQPHYKVGSLVITEKTTSREITKGEVIVFRPPAPYTTPNERPVMHRIVKIAEVDGQQAVWTKGDANPAPDQWILSTERSPMQHAVKVIPYAGIPLGAITNASHAMIAVIVLGLLLLAYATRRTLHSRAHSSECQNCLEHSRSASKSLPG